MRVAFGVFQSYRLDEHNARDVVKNFLSEMDAKDYISLDFVKEWVKNHEERREINVAGVYANVDTYDIADAFDLWTQIRDGRIEEICDYFVDSLTGQIEWGFKHVTRFKVPFPIHLGYLVVTVYEENEVGA